MTTRTKSAKETQKFGKEFAQKIKGGGVIFLYGELGAGKTTFVQGLAKGLGIKKRIVSPTFILARRYPLPEEKFFWHVDLYRLNDSQEVEVLGLSEKAKEEGNIMVVEWPEKIAESWPRTQSGFAIKFKTLSEKEREISYEVIS